MRLAACEIVEDGIARVLSLHDAEDPKRQGVRQEIANEMLARARMMSPEGKIYLAWVHGANVDDLVVQDREDGTVLVPKPPKLRIESLRESGDRIVALEEAVAYLRAQNVDIMAQVEALKAGK